MAVLEKAELIANAAGRHVPETVNGRPQVPYMGVGKYRPTGRKVSPPISSASDARLAEYARATMDQVRPLLLQG